MSSEAELKSTLGGPAAHFEKGGGRTNRNSIYQGGSSAELGGGQQRWPFSPAKALKR